MGASLDVEARVSHGETPPRQVAFPDDTGESAEALAESQARSVVEV
jgi:hypothetical protein